MTTLPDGTAFTPAGLIDLELGAADDADLALWGDIAPLPPALAIPRWLLGVVACIEWDKA